MIIIMIKIMSIVSIIIQSQAAFVSCLHLARFTIVHSKTKYKVAIIIQKNPNNSNSDNSISPLTRTKLSPVFGGGFHPTFQSFLLCRLTRTRITRIPR